MVPPYTSAAGVWRNSQAHTADTHPNPTAAEEGDDTDPTRIDYRDRPATS